MKINKKFLGIFLGLGLVSTFFVVVSAYDNVKFEKSKTEIRNINENKENLDKSHKNSENKKGLGRFKYDSEKIKDFISKNYRIKPNNFDHGERIDAKIKIDGISKKENTTTEKDLVNYVMVMSKVLYDNGLLSEEIIDELFDEFKGANNLKLYRYNGLSIRGEENFRKLQNVFAKTNFKNIKLNEENFRQTIEKIKEVLLKEKNKVERLYRKIKEAFDNNDEKALVECQNMRERDIILQRDNKIKKSGLTEKEKENIRGFIKELNKSIEDRTKKGKLDNFGRKLLLDIKNDYEKRYIPKLNKSIEKINNIKFKDVKDLHKNLKINKNIKLLKGIAEKKEKN